MQRFEPGNLVRLKSGGPTMTVRHADEHGVNCSWFEDRKSQFGVFPAEALDAVDPVAQVAEDIYRNPKPDPVVAPRPAEAVSTGKLVPMIGDVPDAIDRLRGQATGQGGEHDDYKGGK